MTLGTIGSAVRSDVVPESQTNLAGDLLVELQQAANGPLHERLTRALRAAVNQGRLPVGSVLPPSRTLAADLGCSRWAVTEAYAQLVTEGYLESRTGSGTTVRWSAAPEPAGSPPARPTPGRTLMDLAPGLPDLRAFPRSRWADAVAAATRTATFSDLGYPDATGHRQLKRVLAAHLERARAASTRHSDVRVTRGVSSFLPVLCRVLADEGVSAVAVEDPGWTRLHQLIRDSGVRTVPVPVDDEGLVVDRLAGSGCRAALVTAAHHFPAGVVLTARRRAQLLDWAREVDGFVLEDDYDSEFRYDRAPVSTLQGMDPSRVVLLGSLSKTLSPALGIGWAVTPRRLAAFRLPLDAPTPGTIEQLAFASLVQTGAYDRHLRATRRRYLASHDALITALRRELPECDIGGAAAGLHLLLRLPDGVDAAAVVAAARARGVATTSLGAYCVVAAEHDAALVLGYGNLADADLPRAVSALAAAVRETTAA